MSSAAHRNAACVTGAAWSAATAYLTKLYMNEAELSSDIIWPPSHRSAPLLASLSLTVVTIVILSALRTSGSAAQTRVRDAKKKLIMAQLTQALRWDHEDPADEGNDGEDPKPKRPPETTALFEMLYDEVEERHVTSFGIDAKCSEYQGVLSMFKERLPIDVAEAARCTRIARGMAEAGDVEHNDDLKRIVLFKDGTKLRDLVKLYEQHIRKNFGHVMPRADFQRVKASYHMLERDLRQGGYRLLFALLRPHLPLYLLAVLLMAFDSAVGAANWHAIGSLLDGVGNGTMSLDELKGVFVQSYAKFILCIFAHLTSWAFTHTLTGRFSNAVRGQVLRGVLRQDTVFFDVYPCGVIQERLNHDANDLASKCFHLPLKLVHNTLIIVSNAYAVYCMNTQLLWVCIAPIPATVLVQRVFIKWMRRMHSRGRKVAERVVANTNEVIKELRTVRSFAMEAEEAETYEVNSAYRVAIEEKTHLMHHCVFIAPLVMLFVGTRLLATYLGGTFVASGTITVGMAIQIGNAADHLQHCMREVSEAVPDFFKVFGPIGRVCDAISSRPTIEPHPGGRAKLTTPLIGQIDFVDVNFTFPSEPQKQILHGLSFTAKPGEKVAFVGPTGCGKSTAIQIIQRFYAQSSGRVLIDGIDIDAFDVHHLRRSISVVAQDTVLFSTTVRENITYGLPRARRDALTDADIEDACRKANAWDFINAFPAKLETFCGERGVKLSGGQKQRLAIARAIIRKPTICLLDEATSALDSKAEGVVQAALDTMIDRTAAGCTIMIAHRLSTVRNCDMILAMDKGHVIERGTHDELLEIEVEKNGSGKTIKGLYRDLWETQHGKSDSDKESDAIARLKAQVARLEAALGAKEAASCTTASSSSQSSDLDDEGSS